MSRDLKLSIVTQLRDRLSEPLKNIGKGTVSAVQSLNKLRDELDELRKSEAQLSRHQKLDTKLNDTAAKLNAAQREYAALSQQISETTNPTKALQQEFERKGKSVERLNSRLGEQTKKLNESSNKLTSLGIDTKNLSSEEKRLASSIEQTNTQFQQQKSRIDKVNAAHRKLREEKNKLQKTQQLASSMSVTGAIGYSAGTRSLRGMLNTVMPGIAFDKTMSKVQSLTGLNKGEEGLISLREQAKELGRTTMFTATEVAEAQSFLAMAGMEAKNIQLAMPGLLDLSLAGDMAIERSADIVSNMLEAMQIPADQMGRVSDSMVAAFTRSNVSVEMIGETMKYVAGTGHQLGIDLETLLAATGLMGNAGVQAGQAGTALRSIVARLAAPVKMTQDALDGLNIETTDKDGNLRNFIELLDEINEKTQHMGNAERAGIIKAIAGTEAMTAMQQLLSNTDKALGESGASNFTEFLEQIRNSEGEAAKVAKTMTDNLLGDWTALTSAWEGIGNALFEGQNNSLRELVQRLTDFLGKINDWIKANPELAAQITKVAVAVAALVTAGGALLITIGSVLGPLALMRYTFSSTFIKAKSGIGIIGKLTKAFKLLFMSFPGIAIVAAIAAVITISVLLYKNWDLIKEKLTAAWQSISSSAQTAFNNLKQLVSDAIEGIKYIFLNFSPIGIVIKNWDSIKSYMANLWQSISSATQTAFFKLKNIIDSAIEKIKYVFWNFHPLGIFIKHFDDIKEYLSNLPAQFLEYGKNIAQGLANGIKSGVGSAVDAVKNLGNRVVDRTTGFFKMRSPSRLFAEFGQYLPEGLAIGINRSAAIATKAATAMAITTAAAASSNMAMANTEMQAPIRFDSRPSLMAMAARAIQPATTPTAAPNITINVYAAPGQSAEDVAQQVRQELERIKWDEEARKRSSYTDYGY